MIGPLRARHRRTWAVLAVLLPLGYVAAISSRPAWPLDAAQNGMGPWPQEPDWEGSRRFDGGDLSFRLQIADGRLIYRPLDEADPPDVLLYWSPVQAQVQRPLPAEAVLLGAVGGRAPRSFDLPEDAADSGWLVFYSLAHGEVLKGVELPWGS